MIRPRRRLALFRHVACVVFAIGAPFTGCVCGEALIVDDIFVPPDERAAPGTLHAYASNAKVGLEVRSASPFLPIDEVTVLAGGGGNAVIDPESPTELDGDKLKVTVLTQGAGEGFLAFTRNDEVIAERTLTIVDADAMALSVTAPTTPGIALPNVDPANVRIFAGSKAAFRTTLSRDGDEIFGLDAVARTSSNPEVTTRNGTGPAADAADQPRNAVEIAVPETVVDDADVTLTSGAATVVVTVVPTTLDEINNVALAVRNNGDLDPGDKTAVIALVSASGEPVFGAPVTWTVNDAPVEDDEGAALAGDALEVSFQPGATAQVNALLGDRNIAVEVESDGSDPNVTSITAACGASSGAPIAMMLLALFGVRTRRRWS